MRKLAGVAVAGCIAVGLWASPAFADDHTINGTMTLTQGSLSARTGAACEAGDGYDDISTGVTVKVRDSHDKVIGVGALKSGRYVVAIKDKFWYCAFPFKVKVPDATSYSIEVSHRGSLTYTKKQMAAKKWTVDLQLGS